jgi:hypothetical protein
MRANDSQSNESFPNTKKTNPTPRLAKLASFCSRASGCSSHHGRSFLYRVLSRVWARAEHSLSAIQRLDEGSQRQLESGPTSISSFILSNDSHLSRASGRSILDQEKETPDRGIEGRDHTSNGEKLNMPLVAIKPGKYLQVKYPVPRNRWVEYEVEADRPVSTFILDETGLQEFMKKGADVYSYYGGFHRRRNHHQELRLPFKGDWYLVIENEDDKEPVAVHYEVSG